ncbi:MAG: hypothetical protein AAGF14_09135, partial [Pseudomonadota bacterium]
FAPAGDTHHAQLRTPELGTVRQAVMHPGGPEVERHAVDGDPDRFDLPRPLLGREAPDFSFAGLKTALRRQAEQLAPLSATDIADLCASFQQAVGDVVADRTATAMRMFKERAGLAKSQNLVVAGGVAANQAMRTRLAELCQREQFTLHVPPASLCTDNGAMVAWAGAERLARGLTDRFDFPARARWPLDPDAAPKIGAGVKA